MAARSVVAQQVAAVLLAGEWSETALIENLQAALGRRSRALQRQLLEDVLKNIITSYPPSPHALARLLLASSAFDGAAKSSLARKSRSSVASVPARFAPAPAFTGLAIPRLETPRDLADWVGVDIDRLEWLADARRQHHLANTPSLQNYHYAVVPKRSGGARLIEEPKSQLKSLQRKILRAILDPAPVHERAHGFVRGRSCLSSANVHAGEYIVVAADLAHFFSCIGEQRVHGLFRSLGYPWAVARLLTGLCTTTTPKTVLTSAQGLGREAQELLSSPHLPQGAPTSPALANLCSWALDQRLAGLARRFGANYTRYADDLAFSGDEAFGGQMRSFFEAIGTIVRDAGFHLNRSKTRIMRAGSKQKLTGVVVNRHVNVDRAYFDGLKATLHNCAKKGAADQNREGRVDFRAQLEGRVGWVETVNPDRGAKLRAIFDRIAW